LDLEEMHRRPPILQNPFSSGEPEKKENRGGHAAHFLNLTFPPGKYIVYSYYYYIFLLDATGTAITTPTNWF
jgi:hypothetical protein